MLQLLNLTQQRYKKFHHRTRLQFELLKDLVTKLLLKRTMENTWCYVMDAGVIWVIIMVFLFQLRTQLLLQELYGFPNKLMENGHLDLIPSKHI